MKIGTLFLVCLCFSFAVTAGPQEDTTVHMKGKTFNFYASWRCKRCGSTSMDGVKTCPYCGTPKSR